MSDGLEDKVDKILQQVTATNGRVTELEGQMGDVRDVLYGDRERATPGLVAQSHEVGDMLRQWGTLAKMAKWAVASLGTATVALVANLIAGG